MTNSCTTQIIGTGERDASNFVGGPLPAFSSTDEVAIDPHPMGRDVRQFENGILRMGERGEGRVIHPYF
jgi:hypothetical protein